VKSDINHKLFAPSLRILYEIDVIGEDAILEWYYDERSTKGTIGKPETYLYHKLHAVVYFRFKIIKNHYYMICFFK